METTMVLFVFFFILMIGMGIYSNFQTDKLEQLDRKFNQQESIERARNVLNLYEISCSNSGVRENNCFDVEKLPGFRTQVRENPLYYQSIFGSAKATLILPAASYPIGNFFSPDFFNVNNGNDPLIAFAPMPWEVSDYDGDLIPDNKTCDCDGVIEQRDVCYAAAHSCGDIDDDDDNDGLTDFTDNQQIQPQEEEQLLFDFSGDLQNSQAFYFPVSLLDARYVPEKSYFGWIKIEVFS